MQKLFAFIVAKRHWFLFIGCEIIAFIIIFQHSFYQRNVIISSSNAITGSLLAMSNTIFSYFDLQKTNDELVQRNSLLETEVIRLHEQVNNLTVGKSFFNPVFLKDSVLADSLKKRNLTYRLIPATVASHSVRSRRNYITINKGSNDGIRRDMGVISPQGIVGIITEVSDRFAVAMSLLNVKSTVNCKIRNTHFFGPLSWKGDDVNYAYLEHIPTHAIFHVGDTIVTSGNSDVFPPGILVGMIDSYNKKDDDNFYTLKVRFSTDFQSLHALNVVDNQFQKEQKEIEREARKND